jgi:hypothetical protein
VGSENIALPGGYNFPLKGAEMESNLSLLRTDNDIAFLVFAMPVVCPNTAFSSDSPKGAAPRVGSVAAVRFEASLF